MLQWTISRKPNCIFNARVGSSETTREASYLNCEDDIVRSVQRFTVNIMPTPVSALLHAATLVTAGIYLLLRCSPILEYSSTALLIITLIGSTTAFFAGTCGLLQNDLKRIIAFSTISQLGYMMMAIGLSQYNVALMHTVNHAFFKALLFLGAGAVIHSFADQQDVRKMGGLIKFLPFSYSVMLVGSLSLLATPFLTGFYSKDLILELAFGKYNFSGLYAYILGSIT